MARLTRRADERGERSRKTAENLHRQVDGPGRMTAGGWLLDPDGGRYTPR